MALKPRADITGSPKQECQLPTKRTDALQTDKMKKTKVFSLKTIRTLLV